MVRLLDLPQTIRPFAFHGLNLTIKGEEARGDCPFCGRDDKFSINVESGVWRCWTCDSGSEKGGGNIYTFLHCIHELEDESNHQLGYEELAANRKLINTSTLIEWGVKKSPLTDDWMMPGYNAEGKLSQLCRYIFDRKDDKYVLWTTPELNQSLYGMPLFDSKCETVYLAEKPWDAMALREILSFTKCETVVEGEGETKEEVTTLEFTGNKSLSMLSNSCVLATHSANVFNPQWASLFANKRVILLFDNDYPRRNEKTDNLAEPAGHAGMKRVTKMLYESEMPPKEVLYLSWHIGGENYDSSLPSGYDIRDLLTENDSYDGRIDSLARLLELIRPVPEAWKGRGVTQQGNPGDMELLACHNWRTLNLSWVKALKWTEGHDRALSVMLACILSTETIDDQLWVKIVGPPGVGKSVLCQALAVNKRHVKEVNIFRGFHSGWKAKDGDGKSADHSLIEIVRNKTMVTKDGDTLLQQPNLTQILAEARDIYDGASQSHYRNAMGKEYKGVRMTWILCGTASLHRLDSSELGERFLDCVIMHKITREIEEDILWRKVNQSHRNMAFLANGKMEAHYAPEMAKAMSLTAGYISYLRANANALLQKVHISQESMRSCMSLARFVAFLRCRPSKVQEEEIEVELGTRLVSQLSKLAHCLAAVLNKQNVDEEVMRRVRRVALDTARGRTFRICSFLFKAGMKGQETKSLAAMVNHTDEKTYELLRHLKNINAVESFRPNLSDNVKGTTKWRLTPDIRKLYEEVMENE